MRSEAHILPLERVTEGTLGHESTVVAVREGVEDGVEVGARRKVVSRELELEAEAGRKLGFGEEVALFGDPLGERNGAWGGETCGHGVIGVAKVEGEFLWGAAGQLAKEG